MKIKYNYLTQTQIGSLFGESSHKIGKWLVELGLRDEKSKKPTNEAHRGGYCETAPSGQVGYHWVWNAEKTVERLRQANHRLLSDLPEELVEPPTLTGPFRISASCSKEVLNADGTLAVRAGCRRNAVVVMKLLDFAYQRGLINKLTERQQGTAGE
ncbi:MAG TPA: hypothetical protein PKD86_00370 [Gemmatales bacterium]|mgnify:CR=1 FL=1|nr:hypothetical protein [Gemmatales bacterium]HMP57778.1 hypothetical protein [Gemmatales bacterium]